MADPWYAISLKQPWAALLVSGRKTIEVRTWKTRRRGPILIHASKTIDPRPEAWAWVTTPQLLALTAFRGGIVGRGELIECRSYPTAEHFDADQPSHLNDPSWFRPEGLHGFVFENLTLLRFTPCPGNTNFFSVPEFDLK